MQWRHWQTFGAESWVLSVLRDGYPIPFKDSTPPVARSPISFLAYWAGSPWSLALRQEVEKMLSKDALEIVLDPGPGFYSRLFLMEKVTGSWCPVIDLSHLNEFVLQIPFKMETVTSVLLYVRAGDFLASIDLKDAYFQIPVHQSSKKLLRFLSGGQVYQFKALCFGLSTAPQVFTRVLAVVSAWVHSHGIRLIRYLDDWLVLASSETEAKKNVQDLLLLCPPGFFRPMRGSRNFCRWQRHFVLCLLPPLSFGRWSWDIWLRWRGWFLTVDFECALCSGI